MTVTIVLKGSPEEIGRQRVKELHSSILLSMEHLMIGHGRETAQCLAWGRQWQADVAEKFPFLMAEIAAESKELGLDEDLVFAYNYRSWNAVNHHPSHPLACYNIFFRDKVPDGALLDVGEEMPKFEPWCGHAGGTTSNPEAKELAVALIEGSADYLTMITECLLQSHNGIIRVFPAWKADKPAAFEHWVAEGDLHVSSAINQGKVAFIKLTKGANCRLSSVRIKSPWTGKLETHELPSNGCLTLTP